MTVNDILSLIVTDQAGKPRPLNTDTNLVTFGSIEVQPMTLTVTTTEGGTTDPLGTSIRTLCESKWIIAIVDDCYRFLYWTDSKGNIVSWWYQLEMKIVTDTILTANFELIIKLIFFLQ